MANETQMKKMEHDRAATMMKTDEICQAPGHAHRHTRDDSGQYV
jgi:hypothetical protein